MKMKLKHFAELEARVKPLDNEDIRRFYKEGRHPNADKVQDLNKRYRWDLFYAAALPIQELYAYLNDDHTSTQRCERS